jgi:hypothetical protein
MPFLLTPLLWSIATEQGSGRHVPLQERAHGDGMLIGLESPEAFEEVIWRTFFPERYRGERLRPWPAETDEEFQRFFRRHMCKIIALRARVRPEARRYLSKNNGNVARLDAIARVCPDAVLLVPFRDPVSQARSLLEQHRRFLAMHTADAFTAHYMAGIGHYDFGVNLKPIDFGGWMGERDASSFRSIDAWLEYWTAAYDYLLARSDLPISFVSYDALCQHPQHVLAALDEATGLTAEQSLLRFSERVAERRPFEVVLEGVDPAVLWKARDVHHALQSAALGA